MPLPTPENSIDDPLPLEGLLLGLQDDTAYVAITPPADQQACMLDCSKWCGYRILQTHKHKTSEVTPVPEVHERFALGEQDVSAAYVHETPPEQAAPFREMYTALCRQCRKLAREVVKQGGLHPVGSTDSHAVSSK